MLSSTILWSSAQQVEDEKLIIVQEGSIQKFKKKLLGRKGFCFADPKIEWTSPVSLTDVLDIFGF